jgi:prepilin-type N-terminal cleavage/methylation domain-containing protein
MSLSRLHKHLLRRVSRRRPRPEDGFTLIELLVVILIIGILAAIAIPVFLNQRERAHDSSARSDLRNLAGFEEIYLNDKDSYGTLAEVQAAEPTLNASKGVTLSVVRYNGATGYCLSAKAAGSTATWFYDSQAGGLQPAGSPDCSTTLVGLPGGSITG